MEMNRSPYVLALFAGFTGGAEATDIAMCTDMGRVAVELFDEQSPQHVQNFLRYVDQNFYAGTVFHRVVDGFVAQAGGYDRDLRGKQTAEPVENESRNGLSNLRGTLAAARTDDPHSATSQFFVNLANNSNLDGSEQQWGYTVFGRVAEGMDVIDEIGNLPTGPAGPFAEDVPEPLVAITSLARLDRGRLTSIPEETRHEAIRQQIDAAMAESRHEEALAWINQYRATCGFMEPALLLSEAAVAMELGRIARARSVLEEYFGIAESTHEGYEQALALYREVVPERLQSATPPPVSLEQVAGECSLPEQPAIPDGATATVEEMIQAQTAVRAYMTASEQYLDCLSELLEDEELEDEERALLVSAHNSMVSVMESVAAHFNEQVRIIRGR